MFESTLQKPLVPFTDVFNFIFHHGRRAYSRSKVLYRVDGTNESLNLAQLKDKSRKLASLLKTDYDVRPGDVVSIFAKDRVSA